MKPIRKFKILLTISLVTLGLLAACENPESDQQVFGDPSTPEGLALQIVLGQIARPVFYQAYNYQTALGYCRNNYKIPLLDFSSTDANCQSDANCTVQTSKCTQNVSVGSCTQSSGLESRAEDVYYSPTYTAASAAAACANLNGSFSASYIP